MLCFFPPMCVASVTALFYRVTVYVPHRPQDTWRDIILLYTAFNSCSAMMKSGSSALKWGFVPDGFTAAQLTADRKRNRHTSNCDEAKKNKIDLKASESPVWLGHIPWIGATMSKLCHILMTSDFWCPIQTEKCRQRKKKKTHKAELCARVWCSAAKHPKHKTLQNVTNNIPLLTHLAKENGCIISVFGCNP